MLLRVVAILATAFVCFSSTAVGTNHIDLWQQVLVLAGINIFAVCAVVSLARYVNLCREEKLRGAPHRPHDEDALKKIHDDLEQRAWDRTAELHRVNEKLTEEISKRAKVHDRQRVMNNILQQFARTSSRKIFLDATVQIIPQWSDCEFVGVRIRDEAGNIPFESQVGFDDSFLAQENHLNIEHDNCICIRAIVQRHHSQDQKFISPAGSFSIDDTSDFMDGFSKEERSAYRGTCIARGFRSLSVVPIRFNDRICGAIHIADLQAGKLPLETVHFIEETISPLVGEAVQRFNAEADLAEHHLHTEALVEQRTAELRNVNESLKREIEQRELLSLDLIRSNNDLEQFAYVASHDLKEPLRAVSGFVELLSRRLNGQLDAKSTEYIGYVLDGAMRMQSLINGLLEYSRISTRNSAPASVGVGESLDRTMLNLRESIQEAGAVITHGEMPIVKMDALQLEQLFQNLIGNAIKFRANGVAPQITVTAERTADSWQFAVRDNGIGIDRQYSERVFIIFQRLHTRTEYPGTGIGLALCKKIVERNGGKIWVESKPGEGSAFFFTIPDKVEPAS